jgi:P4 family phage/plasmid primase-like protien
MTIPTKRSRHALLALKYAKLGLLVLPMYTVRDGTCTCHKGQDCKTPGKHPMTPHGVMDATRSRKTIEQWAADYSAANVGIATGKKSGILVLDVDPRNDGIETLRELESELGALPDTVTSKTGGGGVHYVFAYPSSRIPKDSAGKLLGSGVDVLSDGAIMIAPPSRHASGNRYKWAEGRSFDDLQPASLPDTWLAKLTATAASDPAKATVGTITEGSRNTALTSLAGSLRRNGLSTKAIEAALLAQNKETCSPPLGDDEVKKIAASVSKYAAPSAADRADDAEKLLDQVLKDHFHGGEHLLFGADGQFWHYTGKMWERVAEHWIEGRILEAIRCSGLRTRQRTSSLVKQVRSLLEAQLAPKGDPLAFVAEPPPVINCANGELWIAADGTVELKEHRPESYLRHLLEVEYDSEAKCPEYDKALLQIFSNSKKPKVLRRHWHELVGYLIQPRRHIPVIPVLLGAGANGKTVLARTIIKLIGQSQVQAQRIEELDKNRFALGSLLGKLLLLDDDVRAGVRLPDGTLKMISEAKEVTGENKFKPPFNFVVRAVPMLLCNNVPSLADVSFGMMRRLMVIPFNRTFAESEKDDQLFERIWANELPGVLNQALKGYARLLARGRFKLPRAVTTATKSWLEQANPVPAFISECCVKAPGVKCLMNVLYPAYKKWATDAGFTMIQNQLSFRRNLEHLGYQRSRSTGGYQAITGLDLKR